MFPSSGTQIQFPPAEGPYTGDYVLIQEPGRYTLENNISHTYPIGVIITSSSVILDGQNKHISSATQDEPSVGIWISRKDKEGNPVTGVKIQNCVITDEITGVYFEGSDSSEFPWGSRGSVDSNMSGGSGREIGMTNTVITGCKTGIAAYDAEKSVISKSELRDNDKGIVITEGSPDITDLVIAGNKGSGITLRDTNGGEVSGCRIEGNADAGIVLDGVTGLKVWNNILDNYANIKTSDSRSILLNTTISNQTNIIKGPVTGGNLWSESGIPVYKSQKISDEDQNGIGDSPYEIAGLKDHYPLIPSGSAYSMAPVPVESPVLPVKTPVPVSTPFSIITGIHAIIAGDSIPGEMKTNTKYPVELILQNDGSDDWMEMHAIGIRASGDAATWGPEWMPVSSVIPSKQSHTFTFTIQSPSEPGTYELTYQAVRTGQGVSITFGRPYKKVVTVT